MRRRQPPPRLWLMTDKRMGDALWPALRGLPRGSGVVFRHYHMPERERRRLFEQVRSVARRRRLPLVLAGSPKQAAGWRADGVHGPVRGNVARPLIRTTPAHTMRQLYAADRAGADLVFISPVFRTRSHPGAPALGRVRLGMMIGRHRSLVRAPGMVALGGMNARRFRRIRALGLYGWAAIDAWTASPEEGIRT